MLKVNYAGRETKEIHQECLLYFSAPHIVHHHLSQCDPQHVSTTMAGVFGYCRHCGFLHCRLLGCLREIRPSVFSQVTETSLLYLLSIYRVKPQSGPQSSLCLSNTNKVNVNNMLDFILFSHVVLCCVSWPAQMTYAAKYMADIKKKYMLALFPTMCCFLHNFKSGLLWCEVLQFWISINIKITARLN